MAISVTHTFISGKPDDTDATLVRSSNWNAAHTLSMATNKLLGRGTAGTGTVEEITLGTGLSMTGTTLAATAAAVTTAAPQGRLTLQTTAPVMTTTQSAKTTIYYTPYIGGMVPIYDGSSMVMTAFAELSVATSDTTKSPAAIGASKVNDWFVWNDSGTVRIGHGPDWTSDTARSAGTALVRVAGIWLNNASITNGPAAQRGTYVGTTRSNASSQLDWIYGAVAALGTASFFGVWNAYNRRRVMAFCGDSTDGWTYAVAGVTRAANASNTMRHSFVCGLEEDAFDADYSITASTATAIPEIGICYDVTNAFSGRVGWCICTGTDPRQITGAFGTTAIGFHFFQAGECCTTAASGPSFYGDNGNGSIYQSGMFFKGWM